MTIVPISLHEANFFVNRHHRHNKPVTRYGGKWAVGLEHAGQIVGVAIVGRPVARALQQQGQAFIAEVLRVAITAEAPRNANSVLYGACWRIWRQMGGTRLVTYTLKSESGSSLRGAGYELVAEVNGEGWNRESRPRLTRDIYGQEKFRWERRL